MAAQGGREQRRRGVRGGGGGDRVDHGLDLPTAAAVARPCMAP
jgi:hypothetical protein